MSQFRKISQTLNQTADKIIQNYGIGQITRKDNKGQHTARFTPSLDLEDAEIKELLETDVTAWLEAEAGKFVYRDIQPLDEEYAADWVNDVVDVVDSLLDVFWRYFNEQTIIVTAGNEVSFRFIKNWYSKQAETVIAQHYLIASDDIMVAAE